MSTTMKHVATDTVFSRIKDTIVFEMDDLAKYFVSIYLFNSEVKVIILFKGLIKRYKLWYKLFWIVS